MTPKSGANVSPKFMNFVQNIKKHPDVEEYFWNVADKRNVLERPVMRPNQYY